jgi:hypothetical protein
MCYAWFLLSAWRMNTRVYYISHFYIFISDEYILSATHDKVFADAFRTSLPLKLQMKMTVLHNALNRIVRLYKDF